MLDIVRNTIAAANAALDRVHAGEALLEEAKQYHNFAIVQKDGVSHFVLLDDAQARLVNGRSVPLTGMPGLKEQALALILKQIQSTVDKDKESLKPFAPKDHGPPPGPSPVGPSGNKSSV